MLLVWSPYGTWGARGKAPSQVRGRDLGGVSRTGGARARGLCLQVPSHLLSATVGKVPRVIRGDPCFVFLLLCQLTLTLLLKERPRELSSDLN